MAKIGEGLMQVVPCFPEELPALAECARAIWTRYYPPIIGMPQVIYMLNHMYATSVLLKRQERGHVFLRLCIPQKPFLGFAELECAPDAPAFLHKFYIQLHLRGSGAAAHLLRAVEKFALESGKTRLALHVNRHNYPAQKFYQKQGFQISARLDLEIGQEFQMNDYRMEKHLQP
ncbi:MAG: GNAT family N-acetyltransferase [Flavobacteriales bacterium]|nr:GNAT family N-acetyltransferase [Flavobacteriales bacterium]